MKDFYELDDWKQCELPIELIERLGANHVRSLEALSEKEGKARPIIVGAPREFPLAGGNHRGSIFRLLVGAALTNQNPALRCPTWGSGSSAERSIREANETSKLP